MKKTPLLLLASFAAQLTVTSCGKDEDKTATPTPAPTPTPTNKELLVGLWKVKQYADDDNKNLVMDDSELYPPDSAEEFQFAFNNDGTGAAFDRYGMDTDTVKYKWYLSDDKNILLLPDFDPSDSTLLSIDKIYKTDLILKDSGDPLYFSWIVFTKQ
jgi:hypothetical protein